jgi:twinkle protein
MSQFTNSFDQFGIDVKHNAYGNVKTLCPKCSATRKPVHRKEKCLSVNTTEGIWNCHNCGWNGTLKRKPKKQYKLPPPLPVKLNLDEKANRWFNGRGINNYTLQLFKVSTEIVFMPQAEKEVKAIRFPYFRVAENGEDVLVNNKYRDAQKNFRMESGSELIFFNLPSLKGKKIAMITEGEIDCMTAVECGWKEGIVSVPNGASKGNLNLEYLDNCWEDFEEIEMIFLATDGDEPGIALRNELARRLGKHRCVYITYPEETKDLNEVLVKYGKDIVMNTISLPHTFPIDNILTLTEVEDDVDDLFKNGVDKGVDIGIPEIDRLLRSRKGEFTLNTGIPGSGKSTFEDFVSVLLAARHGWKTAFFSPEKQPVKLHIAKLCSVLMGKGFFTTDPFFRLKDEEFRIAKDFVREYFFFYDVSKMERTVEAIIAKAIELVKMHGINKLVIDPYNYLEGFDGTGNKTDFVNELCNQLLIFAKNYDVNVVIVVHPTKMKKDTGSKKYDAPTLYDASDSAHWRNRIDNGYVIHRDYEDNSVQFICGKVRWDFVGEVGDTLLRYDKISGMYAPIDGDFVVPIKYYLERITKEAA